MNVRLSVLSVNKDPASFAQGTNVIKKERDASNEFQLTIELNMLQGTFTHSWGGLAIQSEEKPWALLCPPLHLPSMALPGSILLLTHVF